MEQQEQEQIPRRADSGRVMGTASWLGEGKLFLVDAQLV
jgi:hypothetical protein